MEVRITIEIGEGKLDLTLDEAEGLFVVLKGFFDKSPGLNFPPGVRPFPIDYPSLYPVYGTTGTATVSQPTDHDATKFLEPKVVWRGYATDKGKVEKDGQ